MYILYNMQLHIDLVLFYTKAIKITGDYNFLPHSFFPTVVAN